MNIHIRTGEPRNSSCGDWYRAADDTINIVVKDMPDKSFVAVAVHELIEMLLCEEDGITDEEVTKFDAEFMGEGEPGEDEKSPYNIQHERANMAEKAVADSLRLTWQQHEKNVELSLSQPRP